MEITEIRKDIPMLDEIIYMDAASTTPTPKPVVEAMCDYYYNYNANIGRGAYRTAVKAGNEFEKARSKVARFINSKPEEIIFTKNTTEAINLVAHGLDFKKDDSVVVSNIEHHSNFLPWLNLKKRGVNLKVIKADKYGVVDAGDFENAIDDTTKLVALTHVSNAIGSVQPVYEVGEITEEKNVLYLVDAAQSAGHMKLDVKKLKSDFTAFPGHKGLLGPVGTGFLCCHAGSMDKLQPENLGGGTVFDVTEKDFKLEEGHARFEGGTQNIAGVIGLGTAVDYINRIGLEKIEKHSRELTSLMFDEVSKVENTTVYGNPEDIYGIVAFNINGANPHDVAKILDELRRICVRSGHHCAIPAIRHTGAYELGGSVRASIHCYNTKEEVQILGETLKEVSQFFGA